MTRRLAVIVIFVFVAAGLGARAAQPRVTSPSQQFGHNFGDDYFLANYQQISDYWKKLATESDRITVGSIGPTAGGRQQLMAIVTSPANHKKLARYQEISRRLALADGLTDDAARALAREGKAVVWIDGGLHATETLGAQQLGEMVYQMVSRTDDETMRILDDVVILFVHANPDGNDLVANWYMRAADPLERTLNGLPELYQKYIGHDNNRDFFASTQPETENINRVLYREWFPQILYNHHQSGPAGTVLYSPPLRDPFNYNEDPLVVLGIEQIGNALHTRLAAEGKPGATMRSGGPYDGWWNGGIRNTAAFHNTIAILTEMIGSPTPMRIPLVMDRQLPTSDIAYPIAPQEWHFRQSIDYSVSCNRAILDIASRMKENFLYNRYVMGKHSIERGSTDTWTPRPHRFAAVQAQVAAAAPSAGSGQAGVGGRGGRGGGNDDALWAALHKPADRDPRAFVIPASQPDFPTATKFVNALLETGITVERATREFSAQGKSYPAGSYVVFTAQAFRPHVMDMFEPQDHPDNFPVPGGPPQRPYDNAGWTLAYQMGIEFDRILDGFTGPFEAIPDWNLKAPAGRFQAVTTGNYGYAARLQQLDSFVAVNRLLAAGIAVTRGPDTFVIPATTASTPLVQKVATERGVNFTNVNGAPAPGFSLAKRRIGLWDQYGGSIDAGWARWILEQFEFPFARVFAPELDAGNLNAKYDTLIFVGGAIPGGGGGGRGGRGGGGGAGGGAGPANIPAQYRDQIGSVSVDRTLPQLQQFIENGGTVIAIGTSATNLAAFLKLPIADHLVENGQALPVTKFYAPGSVLRAHVDTTSPVAAGMKADTDVFFDNSPVWTLGPDAAARGVKPVAWFDSKTPLRSGWAWGQAYLDGGVIAVDATVGKGRLLMFGADILQRAQPYGTFKFLFNGIYLK
ncbi:MAG TPA: M14 metallopeptidase family protein [Vicinamibacterales bacterium]|nr:M14 metallopeptidase family protein [Vicinamibacterales bacterium]